MLRKAFVFVSFIMVMCILVSTNVYAQRNPSYSGQTANVPTVPLGQPGLSYRYDQTFGETQVAYPSDTQHINFPWGLSTDGTSVWIGEYWGNRALKYSQAGSFQMQIGISGNPDTYDSVLFGITDVTTDPSGNIWVVDGDSHHVLVFDASGNKINELGDPGNAGTGNDQFDTPQSLVFDATGNIYVSDGAPWYDVTLGNHRIQIFDSSGAYLATIGNGVCGTGNDQLCGPRHIAIYGNQLFVADTGNQRIQIFDISAPASPSYLATIGATSTSGSDNSHFDNPSGVYADADNIYVADSFNARVQVFDRSMRGYVTTIGTVWGSANNQFKIPSDVAVDSSGYLYVADFVNSRVQQFNNTGGTWTYARTIGVTGVPYVTDGYHYNRPSGVAVDSGGNIYLTEDMGHRLVKLNANGQFQWAVGAAGVKGDWDYSNDRLDNPADVALDSSGKIYVADKWHWRVQIYNPDGSFYATISNIGCPGGVAVAPNDYLYIAESCDNTIQVYNPALSLVATVGESGVPGSDNSHFNWPEDVAVDSNGMIYVADANNRRVQVFNASRTYVRTMGETGVSGQDFDHFGYPSNLDVDGSNRLFVVDTDNNNRIQVFDSSGAYLTTLGGWGYHNGQLKTPLGVDVDSNGDVYVADWGNDRIQKFAPGVPGWRQANINGFGDPNYPIAVLNVFNGKLYAGASNWSGGLPQIWQSGDGKSWSLVSTSGETISSSPFTIIDMINFNGQMYAGLGYQTDTPASIYRTANGIDWTAVTTDGFGNTGTQTNADAFAIYNGYLYAALSSESTVNGIGVSIYRSNSGDPGSWSPVVTGGNGDIHNTLIDAFAEFNGALYVCGQNNTQGAFIWKSSPDGNTWSQVGIYGLDVSHQDEAITMTSFKGKLYVGTFNEKTSKPGQVWRSSDGTNWTPIIQNGFGDADNVDVMSLYSFNDYLYAITVNYTTGNQVWRSSDGTNWMKVETDGLGTSSNNWMERGNAIATFNNSLYLAMLNQATGVQIWQMLHQVYIPMLRR